MEKERFYHFHFFDIKEPITILAENRVMALHVLQSSQLPPAYQNNEISGETTSQPLVGISTMMNGNTKMVWVGKQSEYPTGWKESDK